MEKNQNDYITLEMHMKFQMRDYRVVMGLKRTWILALIVAMIQMLVWFLKSRP